MAGKRRKWLPDWASEGRWLAGLTLEERRAVKAREQAANHALAPYLGIAFGLVAISLVVVNVQRYQGGLFTFDPYDAAGRLYLIAFGCHVLMALSTVPALRLLAAGPRAQPEFKARLFRQHLSLLVCGMLVVGFVAVVHHARFLRLVGVLILINLIYVLPWYFRLTVNLIALSFSTYVIYWLGNRDLVQPAVTFSELLTLVCLCAVGGAILHRDRSRGYLLQHREQLHLAHLRTEISLAARLQQSLLPAPWPPSADFALHGMMRPAQDIGGDFYDHFRLPSGAICLVVADVCGKGLAAGLFSMSARSALRSSTIELARATPLPDPGAVVAGVNDLLHEGNPDLLFATALYALYEPRTGHLQLVNAGHVKPLLITRAGATRWLEVPPGSALGARAARTYSSFPMEMQPGDTVLFLTDGITEALNATLEEFGAARVQGALEGITHAGPVACGECLLAAVDRFTAGVAQSDDITCIALTHRPAA
jgi:serine phosphatase RsbU (regulator of sigma subunit)